MGACIPTPPTAHPVLLHGRYRLGRQLGRGGCAAVYVAEHLVLRRPVAVKVAWSDSRDGSEQTQRLLSEARSMAAIAHRHVMPVLDADRADEGAFLVMPLLGSGCLERRLSTCHRLGLEEARACMFQLAAALAAVHDAGLVHADVKPANLLLDASGSLVLADFGLCRSPGTWPWPRSGSLDYMAPEQSESGRRVDGRADLYALGCTWYHLLAGQAPFGSGSHADALLAHRCDPRPDIRHLRPEVDATTAELIARLMAIDPAGRPGSARDVQATITAMRGSTPRITERILRLCRPGRHNHGS